jgi:osmotically-inducible protein OsmY
MDRDIRAAVHEELVADPRIDADDIVVEVFNGEVSLNGTVPSQDQDAKAVAAAGRVAGVTAVHNLMAIALPSRDYGDDAALAQLVNDALAANRAVPDGVRATARHGDIFLTGTVSNGAQRAAAEDAVAGVAGVLSVTNQIKVQAQNDPGGR